jgi:VIT1/CCC1 family predicted Fe2+/Mn2+ transporter
MPEIHSQARKRLLEPIDRILEVLFGLIMVLTFTSSLSVAESGREDIRAMLLGALGCNIAWGIIDGLFYLMGCLAERGQNLLALQELQNTQDSAKAHRLIKNALPPLIAKNLRPEEIDSLRDRLVSGENSNGISRLTREDYFGGLAVCGWVILTTFPVALPFIFMSNVSPALRLSNAIAVALMFVAGYSLGRISGLGRWITGISMVLLGAALVAITIALGG